MEHHTKDKKPLNTILYTKEWSAHDFYGDYHFSRIKNKHPIPGTQIQVEREHRSRKEEDVKRFEKDYEDRLTQNSRRLNLKKKTAEFTTRIHLDTIIGQPMKKSEEIMNKNEISINKKPNYPDSDLQISRFMKNVSLGRSHYVSFAVTTGYQSINYPDPEFGHTALHIAASKGYPEVVHELVKYKADPNVKNRLGNFPVHEAWMFWKHDARQAEREEQQSKTLEIIRHLLSYGANPDAMQQDGNTILHIAARLGTVQIVKCILGFKGDHCALNKDKMTPIDVAIKYNQVETVRLLESWSIIKMELVHVDFNIQWRHFLSNLSAVISTDKPAEKILFELNMQDNLRRQQQTENASGGKPSILLEDPLLKSAYDDMMKHKKEEELKQQAAYIEASNAHKTAKKSDWQVSLASFASKAPKKPPLSEKEIYYNRLIERNKVKSAGSITNADGLGNTLTFENLTQTVITNSICRPVSEMRNRRLNRAKNVAMDGKFEFFTERPCTSSPFLYSKRKSDAPLIDTEEEHSMMRYLSTPNTLRERVVESYNKELENRKDIYRSETFDFKISRFGAYESASKYEPLNERQELFSKLFAKNSDSNIIRQELSGITEVKESTRGTKVDMVNDLRSRFVERDLLPPPIEENFQAVILAKIQQDQKAESEAAILKELEEAKEEEHRNSMDELGGSATAEVSLTSERIRERNKVLNPPKVNYGHGRLKSTHMLKADLQYPWEPRLLLM